MKANEISPKKLVVFDIDDTLVHTQTKVHVIKDGEVIDSLNSHDFTHYKLKPGEEFDFSGFRNAREFFEKSRPIIPMMDQLKRDIATGNKVVMVTARADFDDRELFLDTFRKFGIDMGKVHVYRAGNSKQGTTEERKKAIIKTLLDKDNYSKAIMYDDAKPNLHTFIELKRDHPRTRFYAWHVSPEGRASEYMRESMVAEKKNRRKKSRWAAYGPGPYGGYGFAAGYSGDGGLGGSSSGAVGESTEDEAWELVGQPVPEIQQFVKQMGYGNDEQSVAKITSVIDRASSTQIPAASIPKLKNLANKGNDAQTLKAIQQISGRPDAEKQYTKLMQARDAGEERQRDVSGYLQYVKSGNYDPPVLLKLPTGVYVIGGRTRLYAALALGVPANVKIISANSFKQDVAEDQDLTELNVAATLKFIKNAHGDQLYGKLPYWTHPRAVALTGRKIFGSKFNSDAVKAAFLHDVVEDTKTALSDLKELGFSDHVIEAVALLTKDKSLTYFQNIDRIIQSGNEIAQMVKYADNYENYTGDKSDWTSDRAASSNQKYLKSLNRLGDHLGVKHHIDEASYEGNIGAMEVAKFFQKATDEEKRTFKELLNKKKLGLAWHLIQKVTGVKLQGKEFQESKTADVVFATGETKRVRYHPSNKDIVDLIIKYYLRQGLKVIKVDDEEIEWNESVRENFADGKKKGKSRPGRFKRAGVSCKGTVTSLRKKAKNSSGEKQKGFHWCANMKAGRNK